MGGGRGTSVAPPCRACGAIGRCGGSLGSGVGCAAQDLAAEPRGRSRWLLGRARLTQMRPPAWHPELAAEIKMHRQTRLRPQHLLLQALGMLSDATQMLRGEPAMLHYVTMILRECRAAVTSEPVHYSAVRSGLAGCRSLALPSRRAQDRLYTRWAASDLTTGLTAAIWVS